MKIRLTKKQWVEAGRRGGWLKLSQEDDPEPPRDEEGGDVCTQCGNPIDHDDPHTVCDKCRAKSE